VESAKDEELQLEYGTKNSKSLILALLPNHPAQRPRQSLVDAQIGREKVGLTGGGRETKPTELP
jgi:hypothetical protein